MAEKQITDRSTASEVDQAANQLRSAQQDLQSWIDARRKDPTTPREVFDGVDYGPMISAADITAQSRIIAGKYDYVDYGQLSQSSKTVNSGVSLGGDQFFVKGLGTNPDDVGSYATPKTSLNSGDDFSIIKPTTSTTSSGIATGSTTSSGIATGPTTHSYPATSINSRFPSSRPTDPRLSTSTAGKDSLPNSSGVVTKDSGLGEGTSKTNSGTTGTPAGNDTSVTGENSGTDDTGGAGGTGVDSGYGPDNDVTGTDGLTGGPGNGSADAVDVSQYAKPRRGTSGKAVEDNKPGVALRPNALHNYANWTYNIGLYMLTLNQHNSIVENGTVNPGSDLTQPLIKSGGTGGKSVLGDKRDYYIENLRFVSIVGQNSRTTKSSNNFDITFEIVEPYGVAFLAELIQYANLIGIEDQFEIPYLLEIKFRGFDETGKPVANIPESGPKYIPIKIIKVEFKINSAATVYTVTAVPYAHSPLQNATDSVIQESFNIKGQSFEELMASLFGHWNSTERSKAEKQQREPDTFSFEIHDSELKTSKVGFEHVTDGNVVSIDKIPMNSGGGGADSGQAASKSAEVIQAHSGNTLKSTIQAIAAATDFGAKYNTTGQPESEEGNENKPFRLLKIIPVVTFDTKKYNTSTKKYARNIVYKIETQKMYGFITEGMPGAKPTERGWQKEYNWIFTGKNQDIVDFTAEYNVQYFVIRNNPYRDEKGNTVGTPSASGNPLFDDGKTRTGAGRTDRDQQGGSATYSPAIVTRSSPASSSIYNSYRGAAHQLASDHMDNILNNPVSDMIAVDLTIIGDPDWIPQDRSILPLGTQPSGSALTVNGSIATDEYDIFVMLKFKTPRDYNPEKGLMQIDTEKTFVQGLYRVIQLTNTFTDGKFEQTLKMLRVQNQVSNDNNNETDLISGRADRDQQDSDRIGRVDRDQQGSKVTVTSPATDDPTITDTGVTDTGGVIIDQNNFGLF